MDYENPFTPSFGEIPVHLAGRRQIIDNVVRALESERRRPELTTLISGARGTGKTTLLSLLAHKASECGWVAAETTARPGMLEDIEINVRRRGAHLIKERPASSLAGIEVAAVGDIALNNRPDAPSNWRSRIEDLLDELEAAGSGLLITVDEIDPALPEMIELAVVYQHYVREGRRVALLMAGLPHNVSALLSDKTVSFLRRAQVLTLGRIPDYDVTASMLKTINEYGREVTADDLDVAVAAIDGFPFLMQLVGYHAWDASPSEKAISSSDFTNGIAIAKAEMEGRILEATYRELSPVDIDFLGAMLQDEGDSNISDLVERLGKSSSLVAQYRRRLIDAGVIGERRRGVIGFDLPYFKEFIADKLEG